MLKSDEKYHKYIEILKKELIPASGCTEPIAIAYAAAKGRELLGNVPDKVIIELSPNIIKNVKSVVVPNTGGLKGINVAVSAGIIGGKPNKILNVIEDISDAEKKEMKIFLARTEIITNKLDTPNKLDILITLEKGDSYTRVRITDYHTNISLLEKDGKILKAKDCGVSLGVLNSSIDRDVLNVADIYDFVQSVGLNEVQDVLTEQIEYNMSIAEKGLNNKYGAEIGKMILINNDANNIKNKARAYAAAASDARMGGCELPVIINSGSGNQGITASLPIVIYAKEMNIDRDKMYRGLLLSNLLTIYQKALTGDYLSANCGVLSAGASAGAGIAFMCDGKYEAVIHTLVNALAIASGIICDGAKPSCAAKVALSVEAGIMGYQMYLCGNEFVGGEGIVGYSVEETLQRVTHLYTKGMSETDNEIVNIMLGG